LFIATFVGVMAALHSNISNMQLGKMTREEIEKELISTGLSSVAVQGIIDVLSLESLSKLEGFLLICCCWLVIMHAPYDIPLLEYYIEIMLLNWKILLSLTSGFCALVVVKLTILAFLIHINVGFLIFRTFDKGSCLILICLCRGVRLWC